MGCDIHLIAEVRHHYQHEGRGVSYWTMVAPPKDFRCSWCARETEPNKGFEHNASDRVRGTLCWYCDRSYDTFAILANVRNGHGFAGIDTGDGFKPISEPRGLPDDLSDDAEPWAKGESALGIWPGDHSFSWLTLAELLANDWTQGTTKRGVISLTEFAAREAAGETGQPNEWCGAIDGPGIVTLGEHEARAKLHAVGIAQPIAQLTNGDRIHVKISWGTDYAKAAGTFYSRVIPGLKSLGLDPADVRIVFGFDS